MTLAATRHIALIGNPNSGKSALFNQLTGGKQKISNYAGVTVERRAGQLLGAPHVSLLDLPGTYSTKALSEDEDIALRSVFGGIPGEPAPELLVMVLDATNLQLGLPLLLALRRLQKPMLVALNQVDYAKRLGIHIDVPALSQALGLPVIETIAIQSQGAAALREKLVAMLPAREQYDASALAGEAAQASLGAALGPELNLPFRASAHSVVLPFRASAHSVAFPFRASAHSVDADALLKRVERRSASNSLVWQDRLDGWVLHPLLGPLLLAAILLLVFQAVFAWAAPLMDGIEAGAGWLGALLNNALPAGPLKSLLVDGVLAGVAGVVVFLPQILILFAFILVLEGSGYLPRAALLLDRPMSGLALSGRAFIPLLSSFACAVPGIMATRTLPDARERLLTIALAPLMTCSARLPVYTLIIAAFVPAREVGPFNLQGLVLFGLYLAGILSALLVALVLRLRRGKQSGLLLMELPLYRWPDLRQLLMGLRERALIFLKRVGGLIVALLVVLWALSSYPNPPVDATQPAIYYSFAGLIGRGLEPLFAPLGFNWQICIALVPGMAAREVAVSALATVYALSADNEAGLITAISAGLTLPQALSLLVWYVYAPQCLATLAAIKRETNSYKTTAAIGAYLMVLAYVMAGLTYWLARAVT
jgi:ferrous iron transport protein B